MDKQRQSVRYGSVLLWALTVLNAFVVHGQAPESPSADKSAAEQSAAKNALQIAPASSQENAADKVALQKQIAALIEQLGDDNYQRRREAELALTRIGLPAFEQLRQAINHPNVQIDVAARYLVRSQSVTWWLDTDPISVRQVLQDYNDLKEEDRETAMQSLANEKTTDALMALCRIARYESSERLSKSAGLYLMETLIDRIELQEATKLLGPIRESMGNSRRPAANWIAVLINSIDEGSPNEAAWRELASEEYILLAKNRFETSKQIVKRLHRAVAAYLIKKSMRPVALDIARSCLDLVENKSKDIHAAAIWAIDAGLPELVDDLSNRHFELFRAEPQLGFLLAESYLAAGDTKRADAVAEQASEGIVRPKLEQSGFNVTQDEIIATQREALASNLQNRGMFAWAKKEYEKALANELQLRTEFRLRVTYATMLSDGEEYAEAAETLGVLIEKVQANPVEQDRLSKSANYDGSSDLEFLMGSFNYYAGLASAVAGERSRARSYYMEALKHYPENPDILISMKKVIDQGVTDTFFQSAMDESITSMYSEITRLERDLMGADRMQRTNIEYELATQCNQLAWLLSKTDQRAEEALQLSLRSLELVPNYAIYQDTLARCYFACGKFDKAIATQELAIRNDPHQRTMLRQLEEFKTAKAKAEQSSDKP